MQKEPLTLKQAERLRDKSLHLIGQPLNSGNDDRVLINCVAVVPYDDVSRYIFMLDFRQCNDVAEALRSYESSLFDVAVIARVVSDKVQVYYKDIRTYFAESNMNIESLLDTADEASQD